MHGLPTLQYLNDAKHGEGSEIAKQIIAEHGPKSEHVAPEATTEETPSEE